MRYRRDSRLFLSEMCKASGESSSNTEAPGAQRRVLEFSFLFRSQGVFGAEFLGSKRRAFILIIRGRLIGLGVEWYLADA